LQHQPTPLTLEAIAAAKVTEKQGAASEAGNLERH